MNTQPQEDHSDPEHFIRHIAGRVNEESRVVLVVDDEPELRQMIAQDIKRTDTGLLIVQAADGREALAKLADVRKSFGCDPLFIVLDLKMPVMDGWSLIKALRKDYEGRGQDQGIPLIVLSSTSGEKGLVPFRRSVHGNRAHYVPLVSVAKEACVAPEKYDAVGEPGLIAWIRHFLQRT